jgi:dolichyl-phosphate-mannose-protein mannosyltransferase
MLAGVTTPDHLYFDEVHYVPAARQMLEPVMSTPLLNPMHPPLAKQLIAVSIRIFGDNPLGWRYSAALFGAVITRAGCCGFLSRWRSGASRRCCRSARLPSKRRCRRSPG